MNYIARYIYKRPYNGTYAKNYIYVTENKEMLIQTILLVNKSDLASGETLLRKFKDKYLVFRETFFSFYTTAVIGEITKRHLNDSSIRGHCTITNKRDKL